MTMGLLASWADIQKGAVEFFQSLHGWTIAKVLVEVCMIFFLLFFVSKVLRDNDATKLMVIYWVAITLGGVFIVTTDIMSKDIFFIYILLVSALMLIMFGTEIKKLFWDMHKTKQSPSERTVGGTEVRTQADTERCIEGIIKALQNMSKNKVGALVVLSKGTCLERYCKAVWLSTRKFLRKLLRGYFFLTHLCTTAL